MIFDSGAKMCVILFFILCAYFWTFAQYEAARRFFPDLTFWEYLLVEEKIRITPDGR